MRFLVHEHSDGLRAVLLQTLREGGFPQVEGLRSTSDLAPALAAGHELGMLLLDLDAPNEDVLAVCRSIRSDHPRVGLLAMSTDSRTDRLTQSLEAGADHLLRKPLAAAELLAHVRRLAARAQVWGAPSLAPEAGDARPAVAAPPTASGPGTTTF